MLMEWDRFQVLVDDTHVMSFIFDTGALSFIASKDWLPTYIGGRQGNDYLDLANLHRKKWVIFPSHSIEGQHWDSVAIHVPGKLVIHADSLGSHKRVLSNNILRWLKNVYAYNHQPFDQNEWTVVAQGHLGCPQQINGDDCGVYVVALMLCLLLEYEPDFTPNDIAAFRTKLAMWTLAGAADLS